MKYDIIPRWGRRDIYLWIIGKDDNKDSSGNKTTSSISNTLLFHILHSFKLVSLATIKALNRIAVINRTFLHKLHRSYKPNTIQIPVWHWDIVGNKPFEVAIKKVKTIGLLLISYAKISVKNEIIIEVN